MKKLFTIFAISMLLAACSSTPKAPPAETKPAAPAAQVTPPAEVAKTAPASQSDIDAQKLAAEKQTTEKAAADKPTATNAVADKLSGESIFFDYKKSKVNPAFQDLLNYQANWMKAHANERLTLEGNADERGSAEYNLALGNKRAEAVQKALVALGVSKKRIKVVSYGSQKPRAACGEEKCWKENRRVDFVHQPS